MTEWNRDISQAPRGKTVPVEQYRKGENGHVKLSIVETFAPDWLWLATKCGKVLKSHWLPVESKYRPVGRWSGLAVGEEPDAWQPFVVPVHPGISDEAKARRSTAAREA